VNFPFICACSNILAAFACGLYIISMTTIIYSLWFQSWYHW